MAKSKHWSGGRLTDIDNQIKREFNGLPVVDAENDIRLMIKPEDINKAKEKDFEECVFARSCRRLFDSRHVLLMRSVAYIALPDEKGDYRVERFMISNAGKKLIKEFDQGNPPKPGTSFVFKAPGKGQTLEYMRKAQKKHHRKKQRAKMNGEIKDLGDADGKITSNTPKSKNKEIKDPTTESLDIRDGRGLVQMKRGSNE